MRKYRNKKIKLDGYTFDSKLEARRYQELKLMERAKVITDLALQPRFEIIPTLRWNGKTYRVTQYIADFSYKDQDGNLIVEDTKGYETDVYKLKRKLFLLEYGDKLEFKEIRK